MSGEAQAAGAAPQGAANPQSDGSDSSYAQDVKAEAVAFFGRPAMSNPIKGLKPEPVEPDEFTADGGVSKPAPKVASAKTAPESNAGGEAAATEPLPKPDENSENAAAKKPESKEPKGLPVENFFTKEEKALFEQVPPELAEKVKPLIAPFARQRQAEAKGVQKYIKDLGPLAEIAKDPGSVGFTRLFFENPPLLEAASKLAEGFIDAAKQGKPFDPAVLFPGSSRQAAQPATQLAVSMTAEQEAKVAKWMALPEEEMNLAVAAEPAEALRFALAARNEALTLRAEVEKALSEMKQKVAPVEQFTQEAQQSIAAKQEMEQWVEGLPDEYQTLSKDEKGELLNKVLEYYLANKDALMAEGNPEMSIMRMGYLEAMHERKLAALNTASASEKASKEAQARATRTASPVAGSAPPAAKPAPGGISDWLSERAKTRTLQI